MRLTWKTLLILGTLTLLICVSCSRVSVQAQPPSTPVTLKPSADKKPANHFCERDKDPASGELFDPIKCTMVIDCEDYLSMPMWDVNDIHRCPNRI